MLLFIVPRFAELFAASKTTLPLWTRCLFDMSFFLTSKGPLLLLLLISSLSTLRYIVPTAPIHWIKQVLLAIPPFKSLYRTAHLANLTHQLGLLYASGVDLPSALSLCAIPNTLYYQPLSAIKAGILLGKPLGQCMRDTTAFPADIVEMIGIGEESGKLEHMLTQITQRLALEMTQQLKNLSKLMEPLIMVVLGVVIGGIVIGMYLPIFNLGNTL